MTSRRDVLGSGLAIPLLSLAGRDVWATQEQDSAPLALRPDRFVFDERFSVAVAAAAGAVARGAESLAYAGDPTAVWYHGLDRQWRARPLVVAGMTLDSGLFVLETLARDRGMRVCYHAIHESPAAGVTAHVVQRGAFGPDARALSRAGAKWPHLLGARLGDFREASGSAHATGGTGATITHRNDAGKLHSWVIAPLAAVNRGQTSSG